MYTCTVINEDDENDSARNYLQNKTNLKEGAHIHQPTAWTVPHACAQHAKKKKKNERKKKRKKRKTAKIRR